MPLLAINSAMVTPKRRAIAERVSPACTTYVVVASSCARTGVAVDHVITNGLLSITKIMAKRTAHRRNPQKIGAVDMITLLLVH
jgi:hypothetical protein